jgi:hypothetical protein
MNPASIFDLSLAAAPETVPVHDWQKQELAQEGKPLEEPGFGVAMGRSEAQNTCPLWPLRS